MRKTLRKKANIFLLGLVLLFVTYVMFRIYIISASKVNKFENLIGEQQIDLIKTYQRGEKALYFMDLSSESALKLALYNLGLSGGVGTECDKYLGYSVWNTKCSPEKMKEGLASQMKNSVIEFFSTYPEPIPVVDYDAIAVSKEGYVEVGLLSKKSVRIDVTGAERYNFEKDDLSTDAPRIDPPDGGNNPPPNPNPGGGGGGGSGGISGKCAYVAEYAIQYIGCPYSLDAAPIVPPSGCFARGLTCATFVSSAIINTLGQSEHPWGHGRQKCDSGVTIPLGSDPNVLQSGDIFASEYKLRSGALSAWGHTGMYVGRGRLEDPKPYWGTVCYLKYIPDPQGEQIFIHSMGNQNLGQPGVCFETYSGLFRGAIVDWKFCRPRKCAN